MCLRLNTMTNRLSERSHFLFCIGGPTSPQVHQIPPAHWRGGHNEMIMRPSAKLKIMAYLFASVPARGFLGGSAMLRCFCRPFGPLYHTDPTLGIERPPVQVGIPKCPSAALVYLAARNWLSEHIRGVVLAIYFDNTNSWRSNPSWTPNFGGLYRVSGA